MTGQQLGSGFSAVGGMPAARFVQGTVKRVSGTQVFVVCPTFDAGLEFGPVRYAGGRPTVGADCVVAVMTGTTEAWLVNWDGPSPATLDPWHDVGGAGEPFFQNGWENYGGGYSTMQFRKDPLGRVTLRGLLKKGGLNWVTNEVIFTLPVGYRPALDHMFNVYAQGGTPGMGRVDVRASGVVILVAGAPTNPVDWLQLDEIEFDAAGAPTTPYLVGPQGPPGPPGGLPIYSTTTPVSPVDGQEWIYPTSQEGVVWRFRYNASNPSAYKWEYIGGSAIHAYDDPLRTTVSTTPAAIGGDPTMPPLPWFGVYEVQWDLRTYGDNVSQSIQTWLYVVGVGSTYVIDKFQTTTSMAGHESRTATLSLQPGWVMSLRHNVSFGTGFFQYRHLCLKPVYVQG